MDDNSELSLERLTKMQAKVGYAIFNVKLQIVNQKRKNRSVENENTKLEELMSIQREIGRLITNHYQKLEDIDVNVYKVSEIYTKYSCDNAKIPTDKDVEAYEKIAEANGPKDRQDDNRGGEKSVLKMSAIAAVTVVLGLLLLAIGVALYFAGIAALSIGPSAPASIPFFLLGALSVSVGANLVRSIIKDNQFKQSHIKTVGHSQRLDSGHTHDQSEISHNDDHPSENWIEFNKQFDNKAKNNELHEWINSMKIEGIKLDTYSNEDAHGNKTDKMTGKKIDNHILTGKQEGMSLKVQLFRALAKKREEPASSLNSHQERNKNKGTKS